MPLANTLAVCLLLLWPRANVVPFVSAASAYDLNAAQQSQSSNSSPQDSSAPASAAQKAPDQSTATKPAAGTSRACPKNSSSSSNTKTGCKPTAATKPKDHTAEKTAPTAPGDQSQKTVIRNGGTNDPQVDLSPEPGPQASKQTEATKKLLTDTDANLKKVSGRQLTESDQDTVKQIQTYMDEANEATKGGEVQRAYNLAVKAKLLSAELAKH
jgi:hypothetical protein